MNTARGTGVLEASVPSCALPLVASRRGPTSGSPGSPPASVRIYWDASSGNVTRAEEASCPSRVPVGPRHTALRERCTSALSHHGPGAGGCEHRGHRTPVAGGVLGWGRSSTPQPLRPLRPLRRLLRPGKAPRQAGDLGGGKPAGARCPRER